MIVENTGWNTRAMAMPDYHDGIGPSTAAIIARQFESCSGCGGGIDPDVTDALYQDRDVIWENDPEYKSEAQTCQHCGAELNIFVEEKAFGVISESQLPDNAEDREDIYFVPVEGQNSYLVINPFQMRVREATPREPAAAERDSRLA